jgi:ribonuclease T2
MELAMLKFLKRLYLPAFAALTMASAASAQTACKLPGEIRPFTIEQLRNQTEKPMRLHPVDSYLLALSWSPAFCDGARQSSDKKFQCERNRFGFVVHGLWPQSSKAKSVAEQPAYCREAQPISVATHKAHLCTVPGVKLMTHEWQKHGVCAFQTPEQYFDRIAVMRGVLKLPNFDVVADRPLTAAVIRDAFVRANPALPRASIMVDVDKKSRLREVRLCYDVAFQYAVCDRMGAPDKIPVRIVRIGGESRPQQ